MTSAQRSTVATQLFATLATALMLTATQGPVQAEPLRSTPVAGLAPVVHQLPRVVITGRVQALATPAIIDLPRVVVTGRRTESAETLLSLTSARTAPRS